MKKSILITGCSTGIGLDAALTLSKRGYQVFATARQQTDVLMLQKRGLQACVLDLTEKDSINAALAFVLNETGGKLDFLFNNGAYGQPGALEDLSTQALRTQFETNVFGWHELTRLVIPVMRTQGHGRIVNCSSVLGLIGYKWRGAYVATKFALEGLTDVLRQELSDTEIKVVLIEPGPITSEFRKNAVPHFEKWVDWKNSARRDAYKEELDRLYTETEPGKFELPPSAVTKKLLHALTAPKPKPRYYVTTPTYMMGLLRRILSTRMLDAVILRG